MPGDADAAPVKVVVVISHLWLLGKCWVAAIITAWWGVLLCKLQRWHVVALVCCRIGNVFINPMLGVSIFQMLEAARGMSSDCSNLTHLRSRFEVWDLVNCFLSAATARHPAQLRTLLVFGVLLFGATWPRPSPSLARIVVPAESVTQVGTIGGPNRARTC